MKVQLQTGVAQSRQSQGETPPVSPETANNLLLAGLAIQTASFFIFMLLLGWCMFRDNKRKPIQLNNKFTITLLVTSILFLLRTTFRLAEAIEGERRAAVIDRCLRFSGSLTILWSSQVCSALQQKRCSRVLNSCRSLSLSSSGRFSQSRPFCRNNSVWTRSTRSARISN